jgi:hypothetical protein
MKPRKRSSRMKATDKRLSWKKIAEEATVDAYNEYEQIGAWQAYLEDMIGLPCRCRVDRKEGKLVGFDVTKYGPSLLAVVIVDGNRHRVDAITLKVLKQSSKYLEAFKKWL